VLTVPALACTSKTKSPVIVSDCSIPFALDTVAVPSALVIAYGVKSALTSAIVPLASGMVKVLVVAVVIPLASNANCLVTSELSYTLKVEVGNVYPKGRSRERLALSSAARAACRINADP